MEIKITWHDGRWSVVLDGVLVDTFDSAQSAMERKTEIELRLLTQEAAKAGREQGAAAASWYFDGNTPDEMYLRVARGIEDGDPEVLDSFPSSPLSGEYADGMVPAVVLDALGVPQDHDWADDLLTAFEDGFYAACHESIEATALGFARGSAARAAFDAQEGR